MGGVCCKDGADKDEQANGSLPGPVELVSAPAPSLGKATVQASGAPKPVDEPQQEQASQVAANKSAAGAKGAPTPAPAAAANVVDSAQILLRDAAAKHAPPEPAIEVPQTSSARIDQVVTPSTAAPTIPAAVSAPRPAATSPGTASAAIASGSSPAKPADESVKADKPQYPSKLQTQTLPQPERRSRPLLQPGEPQSERQNQSQNQLDAGIDIPSLPPPQVPVRSEVLTALVQERELRTSAGGLDLPDSISTKSASNAVALQAHRLTEAGLSVTRNVPSITTTQQTNLTNVTNITTDDEPTAKVKVETTRRTHQAGGGGAAPGDGSSSVSYSHSATSSQQPGSSAAQGGNTTLPPDASSTVMMGSSAAQAPSAAGEIHETAAKVGTAAAATASAAGSDIAATADSIEGSSNAVSNPSVAGSTPSTNKGAEPGFMFGAPRLKGEHKKERKKEAKRSKSQSSGSNASGLVPQQAAGSECVSGSKASGSDAMAGGGLGGSGRRAVGSSAQDATTMIGSSAADPSISSMDTLGAASTPAMGPQGDGSLSVGGIQPGGSHSMGGGGAVVTDFSSVNRRISKPSRGATIEGSTSTARQSANRVCSNPSSSNAASSSNMGGGCNGGGVGGELQAGAGGVPEVVLEAEVEGDEAEGGGLEERSNSGSSRRSSSEHLSIMTPPEGSDVENVLMLICNIFQLPVALVAAYRSANIFIRSTALRLTDDDQWRYSLAQWSMLNAYELRDVLMVPNAGLDERFREYYCVKKEPKVKFFMASPLRSSTGELLGTLCMADFHERTLELTNLLVVNNLQTLVIRQLERDMALAQERAENEVAKEKLQQEMMRALDHFEKCIMFVDTSKPGWEVLYTNLAWEHVTGIPREHVMGRALPDTRGGASCVPRVHVMGRPLQDFFMALGGAALDWSSTADDVAARSEFTVHRVAVRQKPDKLVSLHLRLATEDASGELEGMLPKGLPGWVKSRGNETHNYFVFVEEVNLQTAGSSTVYEALAKHVEKVPGLELSHLLGKGGFGSVYYGTWNGMPVAVKMIDNKLTKTNTEGISLEALMGQELSHPNIVKTIKYVMRTNLNASSVSGSTSRGGTNSVRNMALGLHSRNREALGPYSGGLINSRHGSRNILLPAVGSSGANVNGGGGGTGTATAHHPTTGMMSYMTSAQPGLSGMTSAQMAAAADLTSASAMQHFNRMGTTMTSDTTVAGGGSAYSGQRLCGNPVDGSSGMPPREASLAAAAAAAGASQVVQGSNQPRTTATSTTTSGLTAVGPASVQASSASTAAGPPSIASAGGIPANLGGTASPAHSSRNVSAAVPTADPLIGKDAAGAGAVQAGNRPSGPLPQAANSTRPKKTTTASATLPAQLPPQEAPIAGATSSIVAAYPPDASTPNLQHLTPEQQQAAMTSRFSLAFSNITSGGEVLVPGKGSRSPTSSSCSHTQQMHNHVGSGGSGEDMGEVWIIMEFCDRGSLQDALDRGALKLRKVGGEIGETHLPMMVATACEVASALHYLHDKGIVHGDLTAWNVMLCTAPGGQQDRSGRNFVAKVADFGLSRTLDVKSKIKTRTYGTISHMPPECLISGIISKATDVFAFGVLLWQMYTGLRPWAGMNHGQIIYNVGMKNVQLLFPPGTPPAIADLSSSCTRTNPTQRPSFHEILEKLDNIRASLGL